MENSNSLLAHLSPMSNEKQEEMLKQKFVSQNAQADIYEPKYVESGGLHNLEDCFTCTICLFILVDPLECKACQNSFCSACINNYKKKGSACPLCLKKFVGQPMHRILRSKLESLYFICPNDCNTKRVSYGELKFHYQQSCPKILLKCILDCGIPEIFTFEEMRFHLQSCENRILQCQRCQQQVKFKDRESHDKKCAEVLFKMVVLLREQREHCLKHHEQRGNNKIKLEADLSFGANESEEEKEQKDALKNIRTVFEGVEPIPKQQFKPTLNIRNSSKARHRSEFSWDSDLDF